MQYSCSAENKRKGIHTLTFLKWPCHSCGMNQLSPPCFFTNAAVPGVRAMKGCTSKGRSDGKSHNNNISVYIHCSTSSIAPRVCNDKLRRCRLQCCKDSTR